MKKRIARYLTHILLTIFIVVPIIILIGHWNGASAHYGDNPLALHWHNEGPYIFFTDDDRLTVNYIQGNKKDGFSVLEKNYPVDSVTFATCYFRLDSSSFDFPIRTDFNIPDCIYNDDHKILAISDIESGYKTFRDFLINSKVIDKNLNWTFGNGHLVLVGDFVDRGFSTTQVLWFIYKLEQEASTHGGHVHFILGNHEIKNLQGNYGAASPKYFHVASMLGKQQFDLYGPNSFIGRWLASKNTIELINGKLFVHGGIHPDVADSKLSLKEINQIIRENYYKPYFPKKEKPAAQLLVSTKTGPSWYRGYFKDGLTQEQVDRGLNKFHAKSVVVGHTIQRKVNKKFNGKVIGIDVQHPKDYQKIWPTRRSEGLYIEGDFYFRVFDSGAKEKI